jgi:hypothetical protein
MLFDVFYILYVFTKTLQSICFFVHKNIKMVVEFFLLDTYAAIKV